MREVRRVKKKNFPAFRWFRRNAAKLRCRNTKMIPPAVVFATVLRMSMNVRTTENSKLVISEQKYFPVLFFVSGVCGRRGGGGSHLNSLSAQKRA